MSKPTVPGGSRRLIAMTAVAPHLLAIDQGTTLTKAFRLDQSGAFTCVSILRHRQIKHQDGWVEHDPNEILGNLRMILEQSPDALGVGLANQGETVVAWDARDGRALCNAIVWQDTRTVQMIECMKREGLEELTLARAGLPLDPYFSASKMRWILDNVPEARTALASGHLRLGTTDAFFRDTLGAGYQTDPSTASRTCLMNLRTLAWDDELCRAFGVPVECLPAIVPTTGDLGILSAGSAQVLLCASVVDQSAALYGHGCLRRGQGKMTFGTGGFVLANAGSEVPLKQGTGLLPTVGWQEAGQPVVYALDGGILTAAAAIDWARSMGLFDSYDEISSFDGPSALSRGLVAVPAFAGLGAPHWRRDASATFHGLALGTSRQDMVRAVIEGIAMRAAEILGVMRATVPQLADISVDGGLSRNGYFRQFLADALNCPLRFPESAEATGWGTLALAATIAGDGCATFGNQSGEQVVARTPVTTEQHAAFAEAVRRSRPLIPEYLREPGKETPCR